MYDVFHSNFEEWLSCCVVVVLERWNDPDILIVCLDLLSQHNRVRNPPTTLAGPPLAVWHPTCRQSSASDNGKHNSITDVIKQGANFNHQ